MLALGASLYSRLATGNVVLLYGVLGAGKTTLVRGYLKASGVSGPVRSPTYNLIQLFATQPPVMHADLYRVTGVHGLGIEEYLESHVCFIEWAERAPELADLSSVWTIDISIADDAREVEIREPDPEA
jgi:tRNA threonylcarbamoyladenosine biosynthesis protein TsaE